MICTDYSAFNSITVTPLRMVCTYYSAFNSTNVTLLRMVYTLQYYSYTRIVSIHSIFNSNTSFRMVFTLPSTVLLYCHDAACQSNYNQMHQFVIDELYS